MAAETSQTLDRGLHVLRILSGAPAGMTVTELSAALGVNRTVVYRLVATLEQHALIRRDARGRSCAGSPSRSAALRTSPSPTVRRRWHWPSSSRRGPTST